MILNLQVDTIPLPRHYSPMALAYSSSIYLSLMLKIEDRVPHMYFENSINLKDIDHRLNKQS